MPGRLDFIQRANSAYFEQMYARFQKDPGSVPEDWAIFFAGFELAEGRTASAGPERLAAGSTGLPSPEVGSVGVVSAGIQPNAGVFGLVLAYREFGHLIARVDPLGDNLEAHPLLDLANFGLSERDLDREVDPRPFTGNFRGTLRQLIEALRETYCSTLGVEYLEIPDKRRRDWLQQRM